MAAAAAACGDAKAASLVRLQGEGIVKKGLVEPKKNRVWSHVRRRDLRGPPMIRPLSPLGGGLDEAAEDERCEREDVEHTDEDLDPGAALVVSMSHSQSVSRVSLFPSSRPGSFSSAGSGAAFQQFAPV